MTSLDAYKRYLLKINKNDTNRNINIPKGEFVLRYNDLRNVWLADRIRDDIGTSEIDDISELLVLDKELKVNENLDKFTSFTLPEDFVEHVSSYSLATKEGCSESVIYNWNSKAKNKNNLLISDNDSPSFEYQETFISINIPLISVYKTDFEISKVFLDYYRLPERIDIEGYTNIDGTISQEINPDISDPLVNEIIDYCVRETLKAYVIPEAIEQASKK